MYVAGFRYENHLSLGEKSLKLQRVPGERVNGNTLRTGLKVKSATGSSRGSYKLIDLGGNCSKSTLMFGFRMLFSNCQKLQLPILVAQSAPIPSRPRECTSTFLIPPQLLHMMLWTVSQNISLIYVPMLLNIYSCAEAYTHASCIAQNTKVINYSAFHAHITTRQRHYNSRLKFKLSEISRSTSVSEYAEHKIKEQRKLL